MEDAIEELIERLPGDAIAILPATRMEPALRRLQVLRSALDDRSRLACCQTERAVALVAARCAISRVTRARAAGRPGAPAGGRRRR